MIDTEIFLKEREKQMSLDRLDKKFKRYFMIAIAFWLIGVSAIGYVAIHFIAKWW